MRIKAQDLMITISAFGLLIMLGISVFMIGGKFFLAQNPILMVGQEYGYTDIVVQPGDTLWSIARAQAPNLDPRDVVGTMRELNELASADIYPGQVLTVQITQNITPVQFAGGNTK